MSTLEKPEALPPEQLLRKLERELERRKAHSRLADYRPYAKQREFHAKGTRDSERMLMAGNQVGKTWSAGMEVSMHLTGLYPDWWTGKKFDRPIAAWAAGITGTSTKDTTQRILVGRSGEYGTGAIPKDCLIETTMARGTPDLLDSIKVKHVSGEISHLSFKSYEQGREKWQGETLDLVWFDEEPPLDIYVEGITRTNATRGIVLMTFTPLLGMSAVVKRFLKEKPSGTSVTTMTIDDAEHFTKQDIEKIVAKYAPHEREARTRGIPSLGEGAVFPVLQSEIEVASFPIPAFWPRICGIDFGWAHPSAGVQLAWDKDSDIIYVTHAHRASQQTPLMFAAAVKPWGDWIPWAWPHDGLQHDKGSGDQLAEQYKTAGLNMLPFRSTFEDGSSGLEAGVMELLDRMTTGRFKVFSHLSTWFDEFQTYYRKDGLIVKEDDDLLSATRYAVMMRREAKVKGHKRRQIDSGFYRGNAQSWMM